MTNTAILVTTCDRPGALMRSLTNLISLNAPILVADDSRSPESRGRYEEVLKTFKGGPGGVQYFRVPENRGLACALNMGLSYWLADKRVEWVSYFQDDVEVDPDTLEILKDVQHPKDRPLLTGHDALEHKPTEKSEVINGIEILKKDSCRATHMHAHRDYWLGVMPIPTRELGAPKPVAGQARGLGSNVDWWIASWAPNSVKMLKRHVVCVPGLVRTFLWKKQDSLWDNEQKAGEDQPLHRKALKSWRK